MWNAPHQPFNNKANLCFVPFAQNDDDFVSNALEHIYA